MASSFSQPSSSLTPVIKDGEFKNWLELLSDLTLSILRRVSAVDILENTQKVCTSWLRVCKDPAMWRKIDLGNFGGLGYDHEVMCRHIIDLSQGGLVELDMFFIGPDSLLTYIADRSSNLRSLKLESFSMITTERLTEAIGKLPLLEDLHVSYCRSWGNSLKIVGQSCPNLKTLKLSRIAIPFPGYGNDEDALAIAQTMQGLRSLQLVGNSLTKVGLIAILDNCLDLEHLDLRACFKVKVVGDLEKRCPRGSKF